MEDFNFFKSRYVICLLILVIIGFIACNNKSSTNQSYNYNEILADDTVKFRKVDYFHGEFYSYSIYSDVSIFKNTFDFKQRSSSIPSFDIDSMDNKYVIYAYTPLEKKQIDHLKDFINLNYSKMTDFNNDNINNYRTAIILKEHNTTDTIWINTNGNLFFRKKAYSPDLTFFNFINSLLPENFAGGGYQW